MIKTKLIAAFCGTGKTHICNNKKISAIEIEYWKYKDNLQDQYVSDIKKQFGKINYILISTDPEGLRLLNSHGFNITLIYPDISLRNEYLDRYINRDSPPDFIGTFMKYWIPWINELKEQNYCEKHIILNSYQYLSDVL